MRWWAAVVAIMTMSACGMGGAEETVTPEQELAARPRAAEVKEHYLATITEVQDQLTDQVGIEFDEPPRLDASSGCKSPFDHQGAEKWVVAGGVSIGEFDVSQWPEVERVTQEVVASRGFGRKVVIVDDPDYHKVSWFDAYDAEVSFGASRRVNAIILGACTLP